LETVLEAMVEGVIAVDQDERILLANTAAIQVLDLKTFNVVGRRIWEVIRSPQIHDLIRSTLADKEQRRLEFTVPWTYSTVAAIASRLPGNPCPGAVLVLHDVTDLRRLENLRRDFVSNVSHELKTPLAAITAYAETLLNGAIDDQNVSRMFVGRISEQSERLHTLIFDLLELARIESGEHMFHVGSTEINEVLRSSLDAHQAIAQTKQLNVITEFREDPLMAQADADGLRTIMDNLIGNAIKYSHPGGQITVRSFRSDDGVVFEVEDNGVGIAKEFQARIFERFFRVDRARSREMGGTGLGLSIVKHLSNLFGGNVKVKSQLGQGSTFTVQLLAAE
jgi:two-component system phosphate regulon sensor histidine kinase PhoR